MGRFEFSELSGLPVFTEKKDYLTNNDFHASSLSYNIFANAFALLWFGVLVLFCFCFLCL